MGVQSRGSLVLMRWLFFGLSVESCSVQALMCCGRELQMVGWSSHSVDCSMVTCSIELARVGGLWFRSLLNFHGTVRKSQASISYAHEYGCEPQTDID